MGFRGKRKYGGKVDGPAFSDDVGFEKGPQNIPSAQSFASCQGTQCGVGAEEDVYRLGKRIVSSLARLHFDFTSISRVTREVGRRG